MKGTARHLRAPRGVAVQLALAAMLLRALIPVGWMPNPASHGPMLVICTGHGPMKMMAPDGDPAHGKDMPGSHHGQDRNHDICPFAAAGHLATPDIVAALAAPLIWAADSGPAAPVAVPPAAVLDALRSPRAPPRLA